MSSPGGDPAYDRRGDLRRGAPDRRRRQPPDGAAGVPPRPRRPGGARPHPAARPAAAPVSTCTPGAHTDDERAALVALGDDLIKRGPKWHAALGAVEPAERSDGPRPARLRAPGRVLLDVRAAVRHRRPGAALRRATGPTTGPWPRSAPPTRRLHGVALCDLDDVERRRWSSWTPRSTSACGVVWIPARAPGGRAPGHADHEPFWARLAERGVPFVLHVGSGPLPIGDEWMNDGRPPGRADGRGPEIIGSKDFMVVHHPAERFLVGARARRRARTPPHAARRRHRDGRRLGAGDAAPPRPRRRRSGSRSEPRLAEFDRTAVRAGRRASCASRRTRSRTSALLCRESDPRAVPVLLRLPPRRGRPRPARPLRPVAGRRRPAAVDRRLLRRQRAAWLGPN